MTIIPLADAPITAQQVDGANKPTLAWISWYTQLVAGVRGLMNAFIVGSSNAVTVSNPAGLSFGSWVSFTPSVNAGSAGSVSMSSGSGSYLRVGQLIQLQIDVTLNVTTSVGIIYLNMPVAATNGMSFNPLSCAIAISNWNTGTAMTQGNVLPILNYNAAAFPTGSVRVVINGAYRAV